MKEQPLFAPGDKAVCIDASRSKKFPNRKSPPLVEGKIYNVNGVGRCSRCGAIHLDVGIVRESSLGNHSCLCGNTSEPVYWPVRQTRFVPVDADRALDNEIHESLKKSWLTI